MVRSVFTALSFSLLLASGLAMGQPAENTGDRERYVVNAAGQILVVESPVNNEAQIVLRDGVSAEAQVLGFGDTAPGVSDDPGDTVHGPVTGIGHPELNGNGVLVSSVVLTSTNITGSPDSPPTRNDSAIVTGTPGNLDTVARTLETIDGFTVCAMEPLPQVNASGQVFFGTTVESLNVGVGTGGPLCFEGGGRITTGSGGDLQYPLGKAIYRHTPGGSTDLLLHASMDQSLADEVTTSDPRWVGSSTTFDIIDAHLIAHSHGSVTDSGHALAFAWLTDDPTVTNADCGSSDVTCTVRRGLLYLTGSSIQLVALEQERVADPTNNRDRYAALDKGVSNSGGRVVFKAEDYGRWTSGFDNDNTGVASLNVWTSGGGLQVAALARADDAVPGAAAGTIFNGFPPFQSVNDGGSAAFTAGLEIPGICDDATEGNRFAEFCRGVYHANSSGTLTEVARTTAAAQASGAGASSWTDGTDTFLFDSIGAVAVLGSTNSVHFVAFEALDQGGTGGDAPLSLEPEGPERAGHNSRVGVFRWQNGSIQKVVAEGDEIPLSRVWEEQVAQTGSSAVLRGLAAAVGIESAHAQQGRGEPTATVIRLFTPMPQLRQHTGPGGGFSIRAWLDTTGDGVADTDSMVGTGIPPTPPGPAIAVPVLSTWTFALLGLLLMLAGYVVIRGRPA